MRLLLVVKPREVLIQRRGDPSDCLGMSEVRTIGGGDQAGIGSRLDVDSKATQGARYRIGHVLIEVVENLIQCVAASVAPEGGPGAGASSRRPRHRQQPTS